MGIKLIVEVLDHAPADLTSSELVVLVVLAECANDATRKAFGNTVTETLIGRSRLSRNAWQKAVRRLREHHGIEIRDVVGKTDKGTPVYAYKGLRVTYRMPIFAGSATQRVDEGLPIDGLNGWTTGNPFEPQRVDEGPPFEHPKGGREASKGGREATPVPSVPSEEQEPSSSEPLTRPDVDRLCARLQDWIVRNGSGRPRVTKKWRDAARLMLDRDKRTEDQIARAIDWCQQNEFWRANILSMPKLREKYNTLRLQAERERKRPTAAPPSSAPERIPPGEECPVPGHRYERAAKCKLCHADQLGARID